MDRLNTMTLSAFQTVSTGMPAIGLLGSSDAAGLTVSLAPMTRTTSVLVEVVVDLVHLQHDVVGHLGLGQQHVHVAGQASRDGVDAEPDVDAAIAQLAGQVGDAVLGLGDGHAVARRDDHRAGRGEQFGGTLGVDLAVLAVVLVVGRARPRSRSRPR